MIKINLLPFRAARKRENIKRQISVYALSVILTLLVLGYYSLQIISEASDLKDEEEKINTELAGYQEELNEIAELERLIEELKVKLDVIKKLEEGKTGPVMLLSDIADAVPEGKLWLTSLTESRGNLTLAGTAMDYETVALFMNNLEQADTITTVDLQGATQRDLRQYGIRVSDFVLECKTYAAE